MQSCPGCAETLLGIRAIMTRIKLHRAQTRDTALQLQSDRSSEMDMLSETASALFQSIKDRQATLDFIHSQAELIVADNTEDDRYHEEK
jgi:hypothetical protein